MILRAGFYFATRNGGKAGHRRIHLKVRFLFYDSERTADVFRGHGDTEEFERGVDVGRPASVFATLAGIRPRIFARTSGIDGRRTRLARAPRHQQDTRCDEHREACRFLAWTGKS
jgi:hypothetical protein